MRTSDFSEREIEFIASVAPAIGSATRVAARTATHRTGEPAIVVVTKDAPGRARRMDPAGGERTGRRRRLRGRGDDQPGICHEVLAGRSASEIAARLTISPYTVQDHLKSPITKFDVRSTKFGVRSRAELVAKLS